MAEGLNWQLVGEQVRQARLSMDMCSRGSPARWVSNTMMAKVEAGNRRLNGLELARLACALRVPME